MIKLKKSKLNAKKAFLEKGTCSHTFFYLLNREFGHPKEKEELALDALAGGILQQGYQCGMLWGASMGLGAEALRRSENIDQATELAIKATQHIILSFSKRVKSIECLEITSCDFSKKTGLLKLFFSGQAFSCLNLAGKWGPEAINAAYKGLEPDLNLPVNDAKSCASEVVKKMGGSEEEMVMVAGFAGGMGMSGNACGALAAGIWLKSVKWAEENEKSPYSNPEAERTLENFMEYTEGEIVCKELCGRSFKSVEEHSKFIAEGGCEEILNILAETKQVEEYA